MIFQAVTYFQFWTIEFLNQKNLMLMNFHIFIQSQFVFISVLKIKIKYFHWSKKKQQ